MSWWWIQSSTALDFIFKRNDCHTCPVVAVAPTRHQESSAGMAPHTESFLRFTMTDHAMKFRGTLRGLLKRTKEAFDVGDNVRVIQTGVFEDAIARLPFMEKPDVAAAVAASAHYYINIPVDTLTTLILGPSSPASNGPVHSSTTPATKIAETENGSTRTSRSAPPAVAQSRTATGVRAATLAEGITKTTAGKAGALVEPETSAAAAAVAVSATAGELPLSNKRGRESDGMPKEMPLLSAPETPVESATNGQRGCRKNCARCTRFKVRRTPLGTILGAAMVLP